MGVGAEGPRYGGGASYPIPVLHAWSLDLKEKMTTRGRDTWFRAAPELGNSENVLGASDWKSASFFLYGSDHVARISRREPRGS